MLVSPGFSFTNSLALLGVLVLLTSNFHRTTFHQAEPVDHELVLYIASSASPWMSYEILVKKNWKWSWSLAYLLAYFDIAGLRDAVINIFPPYLLHSSLRSTWQKWIGVDPLAYPLFSEDWEATSENRMAQQKSQHLSISSSSYRTGKWKTASTRI